MKIYAGETIKGVFVLKDENKQIIKDLSKYDISILVANRYDSYYFIVAKSQMSIGTDGSVSFTLQNTDTAQLKDLADFEMKVTLNGDVAISKKAIFEVIDNQIKDH